MFIIKLCQWQNWNWKPLSTEPQPLPIKTIFVATKCDPHDYFRRLQVAKALTNPIHRENILWIARARGTTFSFEVSLENWSKLWEAICFFHFMLLLFFIWLFRRDVGTFVIETLRSPSAYFVSCILPSRFTKCIVFIFISMAQI